MGGERGAGTANRLSFRSIQGQNFFLFSVNFLISLLPGAARFLPFTPLNFYHPALWGIKIFYLKNGNSDFRNSTIIQIANSILRNFFIPYC